MTLGTMATGITTEAVQELYEDFHAAVGERCGKCWALRLCGVCFAAQAENMVPGTDESSVPESVCRRVRAQKEATMKMMVRILAMPPAARAWLDSTILD